MADWAYLNSGTPTMLLNDTTIAPYMERMCATGYEGPLCGACWANYGHAGAACVKCMPWGINNGMYLLVCLFMLGVPVVQMVLHSYKVERTTQMAQRAVSTPHTSNCGSGSKQSTDDTHNNETISMRSRFAALTERLFDVEPLDQGTFMCCFS